jgi:hypothetical protein
MRLHFPGEIDGNLSASLSYVGHGQPRHRPLALAQADHFAGAGKMISAGISDP